MEFFAKVRSGYAEIYQQQPERMKRLDASLGPDLVFAQALDYL